MWQGRDIQAYLQADAMRLANKGGQIGLIGIGFPVPALKYLTSRESFYAKKNGLTVVGTQDNPSDDVTGGEKAANGLLQRYPDMNGVIGYNDPSALGAATAARGVGGQLVIVGLNGSSDGLAAVKGGRIAATVRVDPVGWGSQLAICLLQPDHEAEPASAEGDRASGDADHEGERRQRSELERAGQGHSLIGQKVRRALLEQRPPPASCP